MACRGSREE